MPCAWFWKVRTLPSQRLLKTTVNGSIEPPADRTGILGTFAGISPTGDNWSTVCTSLYLSFSPLPGINSCRCFVSLPIMRPTRRPIAIVTSHCPVMSWRAVDPFCIGRFPEIGPIYTVFFPYYSAVGCKCVSCSTQNNVRLLPPAGLPMLFGYLLPSPHPTPLEPHYI